MPEELSKWLDSLTGEEADDLIAYLKLVADARSEIIDYLADL